MDKISRIPSCRGGDKTLLITKKKKAIKIKKVDKKGKPLKGVEFKMYANKEDALNDKNVLDTQTTNEKGVATFENDIYYGRYIKESQTIGNYQIRNKEKDIIHVEIDNGVRFLGEMIPENMKVTSINQDGKEKPLDSNKNINQELQSLVDRVDSFNENTNWLVFNDNGKEKLIAKKPIVSSYYWSNFYNAGVVFGKEGIDELINADFTHSYYRLLKDFGKGQGISKTYKPTYVTINGKKYIVRLMRGYNDNVEIIQKQSYGISGYKLTKGSEWNRLLLPLIENIQDDNHVNGGRYGSDTKDYVESNMPTLANYSWWTDFGGYNNPSGYYIKYRGWGRYYSAGSWRWVQETKTNSSGARGDIDFEDAAAEIRFLGNEISDSDYYWYHFSGWQPVLEKVDN